jgi:hypothetical protein
MKTEAEHLGPDECWNVTEFAREAGISKQRLYQIWEKGGGRTTKDSGSEAGSPLAYGLYPSAGRRGLD